MRKKGILEDAIEEVEDVESEDEKDEEERDEKEEKEREEEDQENKDQEPVPSATTEKVEAYFQGEQGEVVSKGEAQEKGEVLEDNIDDHFDGNSSDEEVECPSRSSRF